MLATFAPKSCSTARLISTLLAPFATWNTIVRPSSRISEVFSVISGRRMTSVSFITASLRERLLQLFERAARGHHPAGEHHVAGGDAGARHVRHARHVAHRARQLVVDRQVDEDRLAGD